MLKGAAGLRSVRRFGSISRVLLKHGFGDVLDRMSGPPEKSGKVLDGGEPMLASGLPSPQRIRLALEELGPSFIKLGQLMSTRADIFPPQYISELAKLQDRVPPVSFRKIQAVIEDELGRPLEELFEEFSTESLAAASVAQVHAAVLFDGQKVAVKIVRPGIEKKIREDIRLMYYFAEKIEKASELARMVGATNLVKEFERTIFKELDMLIEAGSMEKFSANFEAVDEIVIPEVYWDYTTRSVLVMAHIDGIKMDQVPQIEAHGIDPKEVALIGLRSFSRQLMEFGFFHADPHPANTIVMYDGRVALVDFGITGRLDEETMLQIANLFLGYAEHDYDMVMEALRAAGLIDEERMNITHFRSDLKDISEPFYGRSLKTISVRDVYDQVIGLVLKYQIGMPRNLLLLFKTFIQTEALGKILGSEASLLEVTRPYALQLLQRGYDARKIFRSLGQNARILSDHIKPVPKLLHDVLKQLAAGKQRIELRHSGFQRIDVKFEKAVNRLTISIVIAASLLAGALVLNSSRQVFDVSIAFLGLHRISISALLGLTGYSIATALGVWLVILIFRSGKM